MSRESVVKMRRKQKLINAKSTSYLFSF